MVKGEPEHPAPPPAEAAVAYLVPWGTQASARFLAAALRRGLQVQVATDAFSRDGEGHPRGSLILRRGANDDDLPSRVAELARNTGARVLAADRSWVDQGIDLGSERVRAVSAPRVALAWDAPTAVSSAGAWRYLLERKLGYPVAPVRVRDLGSPWLDQFDVLVLPEGDGYPRALNEDAGDNLKRWVRRGGTLIAVGAAVEYLAGLELLSIRPELRADAGDEAPGAEAKPAADGKGDDEQEAASDPVPGTLISGDDAYRSAVRPEEERPREVPGVLVRAAVDADHWLSAGLPDRLPFMMAGHHIFTPLRLDKGTNVVSFAEAETLVAAGHLWEEARAQLARKPAVVVQAHERGHVIGFAADPAFRGMMDGLDVLVANAVFFGPAVSEPVPPAPPVAAR